MDVVAFNGVLAFRKVRLERLAACALHLVAVPYVDALVYV